MPSIISLPILNRFSRYRVLEEMSEGHSYDIHEKIAQLETELLQHELLIRRQKHVITSLKNMINNPNTGGMASPSASITHAPAAIPAPVVARSVPVTASTSSSSSLPQHAAVVLSAPGAKQPSTSSSTKKATAPTAAAPVRSINHQKKRTAMNKVKQFCKTIPRFGAPVVKLKRSSSTSEGGTEGTSKRQRVDSANVNTSIQIGFAVGSPAARSVANRAVVSAGSTAPGVPRIGAASSSHSTDDDALFDAAGAKLRYLKNTSSAASSMQPVGLMPVASSVAAWDASHAGTKATAQHTSSSSAASALSSSSSKTGSSASASSSSHKVIAGSSKSASAAPPPAAAGATQAQKQAEVARLHVQALRAAPPRNSSSVSDAITTESSTRVSTPPPKSSARTFTSTTAVTTSAAVAGRSSSNAATSSIASASTLTTSATPAAPISVGSPKSITTNKNLLTGSAHKNLDIFDHCKCVSSLEEKLEIAKDMHAYIIVSSCVVCIVAWLIVLEF